MNVLTLFKQVTTFVFDVDGVLTDGKLMLLPGGVMARAMNTKDGYALALAIKQGYHIFVISGGNSPEVQDRLNKLGVKEVFMKVENKLERMHQLMEQYQLTRDEVLFMGDDVPDYECMLASGIACCPEDAVPDVRNIAQYTSPRKGGDGCARDVIEKVMKLRGHWTIDTSVSSK
ncbi:KdsC family phosphatase [Deminuibacter soli]|uniref:HAD family hydrolase n=1 Tax=Deminuibacter soli TaxID=2291815 RepID=A0A3E1NGT2_9BACT|nr:HAD family hydrolase [Deminuibacter soli]RFM27092.1 HAD family hydrolase [Deminuibacter soli]